METPELLTDDMDIRDTKLSMRIGGNGDYYIELKETKRGEVIRIDTRIAMSGGNATTEVRLAVANLFKALRGETLNKERVLPISIVSQHREQLAIKALKQIASTGDEHSADIAASYLSLIANCG